MLDNDNPGTTLHKTIDTKFKDDPNYKIICSHYSTNPNYELEDILPKIFIKQAFMSTIQSMAISAAYEIDWLREQRTVSEITNEFKGKHRLSKEDGNLFEQTFKNNIDENLGKFLSKN